MSQKRVATRYSSRLKAQELGGERGGKDEASQNRGQVQGPLDAVLAPTTKDDFMATDDFMRLLRGYVDVAELFYTSRLVSKPWQRIAEEKINGDFRSGILAFHDGNDEEVVGYKDWEAFEEKRKLVTRVIFLLNITKVGINACWRAVNLVVIDIPYGVESIGVAAFSACSSLITVSFPTKLTLIGQAAFSCCSSLENVDLLHTNLQKIDDQAFDGCSELKLMTIPDSLQTLGWSIFDGCSKLFPSNISIEYDGIPVDVKVVAYLRDQQRIAADLASKLTAPLEKTITKITAECDARDEKIVALEAMVASLSLENAELKTKIASTTPPPPVDDFMATNDFRRCLSQFFPAQDLFRTFRLVCKQWRDVAEEIIDRDVESGELIVHGGNDISFHDAVDREERRALATRVIFLLNVTKVGDHACIYTVNLVVVSIPEGVVSIGEGAFQSCRSLTTVSFPMTLKSIGDYAFVICSSLDNINLLHTNLQELGRSAFAGCDELESMTIPDSLQKVGDDVFVYSSKLVPSSIDINDEINGNDVTSKVIAQLRYCQLGYF
ncbi:hypothetical protein TrLO_g4914 [Triparma laevis f. longispina]|uniref:Uncharacterized protein n=1 Tax=Triparma laevis f. longispina TaxID=1714387 RepID=A0A9W7C854_9STRA|nr:hypothetical protein TrLO_g4914 [Triparma laevis f. longispina]